MGGSCMPASSLSLSVPLIPTVVIVINITISTTIVEDHDSTMAMSVMLHEEQFPTLTSARTTNAFGEPIAAGVAGHATKVSPVQAFPRPTLPERKKLPSGSCFHPETSPWRLVVDFTPIHCPRIHLFCQTPAHIAILSS